MNSIKKENLEDFIYFLVNTENESYRENPNPTPIDRARKEKLYKDKIEEITKKIAKSEGIDYENWKY